jgi:hypothetical protein
MIIEQFNSIIYYLYAEPTAISSNNNIIIINNNNNTPV